MGRARQSARARRQSRAEPQGRGGRSEESGERTERGVRGVWRPTRSARRRPDRKSRTRDTTARAIRKDGVAVRRGVDGGWLVGPSVPRGVERGAGEVEDSTEAARRRVGGCCVVGGCWGAAPSRRGATGRGWPLVPTCCVALIVGHPACSHSLERLHNYSSRRADLNFAVKTSHTSRVCRLVFLSCVTTLLILGLSHSSETSLTSGPGRPNFLRWGSRGRGVFGYLGGQIWFRSGRVGV